MSLGKSLEAEMKKIIGRRKIFKRQQPKQISKLKKIIEQHSVTPPPSDNPEDVLFCALSLIDPDLESDLERHLLRDIYSNNIKKSAEMLICNIESDYKQ